MFRLTPRSLEISAALTSLSRSSWLAQGPVTANLALAWSTAVTVLCTLTTVPVSLGVAQHRYLGAYRQGVEALRVVEGEAGPLLGDLVDVADGVRVWYRFHLGPDAGGFPLQVHEPLGSTGANLSVPAERGIPRAGQYFHNLVFVGVGVVLLSDGVPPLSVLPGASGGGRPGEFAAVAVGPSRVGPPQGESGVPDTAVPGTGRDGGWPAQFRSGATAWPGRSWTTGSGRRR